jgi:hypothetical protein
MIAEKGADMIKRHWGHSSGKNEKGWLCIFQSAIICAVLPDKRLRFQWSKVYVYIWTRWAWKTLEILLENIEDGLQN